MKKLNFSKFRELFDVEPDEYDEVGEYEEGEYEDDEYEDEAEERKSFFGKIFSKDKKESYREGEYDEPDYEQEEPRPRNDYRQPRQSYERSNVINMNQGTDNNSLTLALFAPESIEEAKDIVDSLVAGKTVVISLEGIEKVAAQRITDFMCGACHSVNGNLKRISSRIFIIGPNGIKISGKIKEELEANGIMFPKSNRRRS